MSPAQLCGLVPHSRGIRRGDRCRSSVTRPIIKARASGSRRTRRGLNWLRSGPVQRPYSDKMGAGIVHDWQSLLQALCGQPCSGIDNPHGSVIRLDIGPTIEVLTIRGRLVQRGWRQLTVLSPWRLERSSTVLLDWNALARDPDGGNSRISSLVGATITAVETQGPGWDLAVSFSDGSVFRVFNDINEDRSEGWYILGTDGLELSAPITLGTATTPLIRWNDGDLSEHRPS